MSSTDCRTRINALSLKQSSRRKGSAMISLGQDSEAITFGSGSSPASIFEHCCVPPPTSQDSPKRETDIKYPSSFDEIEQWLDDLIDAALNATGYEPDQSSSIKVLFLDEKKCAKTLHEEYPMNRLLPKLKIWDWSTSHYMSTFCRFPLPLDFDCDDDGIWGWRFTISHPFDWDMLWVYLPATRTTIGIVRTWFDGYDANFTQLENEIKDFEGPTLAHPMLLGLLALQVLTTDAMANIREKGNRIYEGQTATGFHTYNRLRQTSNSDEKKVNDLAAVSQKVIGAASNMTGWENASLQLVKFVHFIQEQNQRWMASKFKPTNRPGQRLCTYIHQQSQKLIGDLDGVYHDSQAWLSTANFLLMGVLNVLGQDDSRINIELAKDQKQIAEEAKRDSTSMTAISVVTMFFLPGTFTASFFALPYFAISAEGLGDFWVYWVVTIPLTIVTLLAFGFYTAFINPPVAKVRGVKFKEDEVLDQKGRTNSIVQEWILRTRTRSFRGADGLANRV